MASEASAMASPMQADDEKEPLTLPASLWIPERIRHPSEASGIPQSPRHEPRMLMSSSVRLMNLPLSYLCHLRPVKYAKPLIDSIQ